MANITNEQALQILSEWMEHPDKVFVPEFLQALLKVAIWSSELDKKVFLTLRRLETDIRQWVLWSHHAAIIYMKHRTELPADIVAELHHIKKIAEEYIIEHHDFNPWQYNLSYNPFRSIVDNVII